ncbi:PEP-CTERM sorting domain-containing protein [Thalassotalea crassostreae]|uniref:PEP-CTERM sorting domain-containing protein n=1 Tax=Thalassotalea crassostreae TaxID=1763536 RepID=UPI000838D041|nr:PEP-CTERM sorting domain-containing protein [Thalassotalea crassostreae]
MKNFLKKMPLLILLISALFAFHAKATLMLTPLDCIVDFCWTSDDNSNPHADDIATMIGDPVIIESLFYKSNAGGGDEGPYSSDYSTTFSNTANDPEDALIEWLEGSFIDCASGCYLSVKDGNHQPAIYVFDISSWDGQMDIELDGFWPDEGAISNIAIWGAGDTRCTGDCGGGGQSIPEPQTLLILSTAILGVYLSRRKRLN